MEGKNFINFEEGQNSLSDYHKIFLKRFYEVELDQIKSSLQLAFKNQNYLDLKRILQGLKGTSGFIGAMNCKRHTEALLALYSDGEVTQDKLQSLFNQLIDHLLNLSDFLRDHFSIKTTNESEKEENSDISTECSKEVISVKIVKTLVPPISRITKNECSPNYDDDEISSEEICKRWNCLII
jgi:chemotaxis protein histidine kinase CheA